MTDSNNRKKKSFRKNLPIHLDILNRKTFAKVGKNLMFRLIGKLSSLKRGCRNLSVKEV